MIKIDKNTMLKNLISQYPWLRDELPNMNSKFKLLNTPLGKMMINKVCIGDMSQKSSIPLDELIAMIKNTIRQRES